MCAFKLKIIFWSSNLLEKKKVIKSMNFHGFRSKFHAHLGLDIYVKSLQRENGEKISLIIWDIDPYEGFYLKRIYFYPGTMGTILLVNSGQKTSWFAVQNYFHELTEFCGKIIPFLINIPGSAQVPIIDRTNPQELENWAAVHQGFYNVIENNTDSLEQQLLFFAEGILAKASTFKVICPGNSMKFFQEWNPLHLVSKITKNRKYCTWPLSHPKFRYQIPYILENIAQIQNPAADRFREWAVRELTIRGQKCNLML